MIHNIFQLVIDFCSAYPDKANCFYQEYSNFENDILAFVNGKGRKSAEIKNYLKFIENAADSSN